MAFVHLYVEPSSGFFAAQTSPKTVRKHRLISRQILQLNHLKDSIGLASVT